MKVVVKMCQDNIYKELYEKERGKVKELEKQNEQLKKDFNSIWQLSKLLYLNSKSNIQNLPCNPTTSTLWK